MNNFYVFLFLACQFFCYDTVSSFSIVASKANHVGLTRSSSRRRTFLSSTIPSNVEKLAPVVNGEELEMMLLGDWEQPLVIDAYATWCGPCVLMAPEFESAAKELRGRVRFAKIDTDKNPEIAGRLNVMGLPTLLFLDKFEGDDGPAKAVLKERIEGAIQKKSIVALCEHHFFGGPKPVQL